MKKERPTLPRNYLWYLIGAFVTIGSFPYFFTNYSWFGLDFSDSGEVGDTIGGIMAPFVAMIAAVLTYMAFREQFRANEKITEQFEHERFENKYYEMVRLHKQNVREIEIDGRHVGRKAFVKMYKEFKILYDICKSVLAEINQNKNCEDCLKYSEHQVSELAYIIFFFGTGEISDKGSKYYTYHFNESLVKAVLKKLKKCQKKYASKKDNHWQDYKLKIGDQKLKFEVDYYPFDGHASKLGHYFRHLYQTIKLATTDRVLDKDNISEEHKIRYQYVKTLRVQLSNHEQAMVYYNSFFEAGKVWWGDDTIERKNNNGYPLSYFLDYGMIKNLPYNLVENMGPHPTRECFNLLIIRFDDDLE